MLINKMAVSDETSLISSKVKFVGLLSWNDVYTCKGEKSYNKLKLRVGLFGIVAGLEFESVGVAKSHNVPFL